MRSRRWTAAGLAAAVPVTFLGMFFVWPLATVAWRAASSSGIAGKASPLPLSNLGDAALTTVSLAAAGTALTLLVGLPATWALHRRPWRGARLVSAALSAPFVLPTVVVALAFHTIQRDAATWLGSWNGVPAIILALAFFNVAVVLRMVGPSLEGVDERLLAAASTLGAPPLSVLRRVVWPSTRRAVAGAAAVTFLFCATSFALVLVLGGTRVQTLETAAYIELTSFLNLRGAAILALVQAVIIASMTGLVAILGHGAGATPHGTVVKAPARREHIVAIVSFLIPASALAIAPLGFLVVRSLSQRGAFSTAAYGRLWAGDVSGVPLGNAIVTSVLIALVAGTLAFVLGALAAGSAAASPMWRWVRAATVGPLAVSSVVVGVGLLLALAVPMRSWGNAGTYSLLVAAQALVALPLVVRTLAPALAAIDRKQFAAAATLGATHFRTITRIVIPHIRPAIASAFGLSVAVAVGEFGASVFLARPGSPTLPTAIVRLLSRPGADNISTASAGAVVLGVLAGSAMLIAETAGRRRRAR